MARTQLDGEFVTRIEIDSEFNLYCDVQAEFNIVVNFDGEVDVFVASIVTSLGRIMYDFTVDINAVYLTTL